jgi:nucleoside-diphosphate-sugar epimerase
MSETSSGTALVVGATGITGTYVCRHLAQAGWRVTGTARRTPQDPEPGVTYVQADMSDRSSLDALDASEVTHLAYTGFAPVIGAEWEAVSDHNAALFDTLMDWAAARLPNLQRVLLMQGQKYYGSHLGPYRTPTREDDPRHQGKNFYFNQQDRLAETASANGWTWTALRPHIVCGLNLRAAMNPLMVIGAYAAICKALNRPFSFPGDPVAYDKVYQATDADLLGACAVWALTTSEAANQPYNITNGDFFRWRHIWERVATAWDLELAEPQPMSLIPFMADHSDLWADLAAGQGLAQPDVTTLVDWAFGDYILRCKWDVMASTMKLRGHGFQGCRDSEEMFVTRLAQMQAAKLLPTF